MNEVLSLSNEEKVYMALRGLYEQNGYTRFKMGKFEEYDLYARNKDFLVSDSIITFTENGKLMALKPDVTLSIVRSSRDIPGTVQKLYYNENVYRVSGSTHVFQEIMQAGLECIGSIDDQCLAEVLILAAKSLRKISPAASLVVSHLGVVSDLLSDIELTAEEREQALRFIGEKNGHELAAFLQAANTPAETVTALQRLIRLHGSADEVLPVLKELGCGAAEAKQLRALADTLQAAGCGDMLALDFSIVNNMHYYNGIVFKGYVSGVPVSVLSGGQYDRLMRKMGRTSGAVGFAVYLDTIARLNQSAPEYDVDTVLLYEAGQNPADIFAAAEQLRQNGSVTVLPGLPEKLRYRHALRFNGTEAVPYDA